MRKAMQEAAIKEQRKQHLSERNERADRLIEKWSKRPGMAGERMIEVAGKSPAEQNRIRNLAIILENQENHLKALTETQISNSFQTTPENVMRIVRLGYPNSIRGEVFLEWAMESARDSIYYLSPVYSDTARGATANTVTHESGAYRYASEIEVEALGTGDGSTVTFGITVANPPLRPYSVKVFDANEQVGADDGAGNIVGTGVSAGTINYTTGAISVTYSTAPDATNALTVEYKFDSEVDTQYADLGSVELQLRDYQFRARPWPLYVSWSKMTELLLGTTLNIDAEEALVRGAADELKKSLDFYSLRMAYQASLKNSLVTFDKTGATGESEADRAQVQTRAFDEAGDTIYNALQRGGVTKMMANPAAIRYMKLHRRWQDAGAQPAIGAYRVGSLDGIDVYKVPNSILPDPTGEGQAVAIWRNEEVPEDVSIAFGSLVPLYKSNNLEFKELYTETGMAFFGDMQVLRSEYLVRIQYTAT